MTDREANKEMVWTATNVRADYLSSSRKRLVPQMLYKGTIFQTWQKKQTVALHRSFYETLPQLPEVTKDKGDVAWLIYDLEFIQAHNRYELVPHQIIYTQFGSVLQTIITPEAGPVEDFVSGLQAKLDQKFDNGYPPDAPTLADIIEQ